MAYVKQTFENKTTILSAEHMEHIEDGIYQNSVDIENLQNKKLDADKIPVQSVNGKTGAVTLNADDVGARPDDWMPTAQEVGALPHTYTPPDQTAEQVGADHAGTAESKVSGHNTNAGAHNDIRLLITALANRLDALANSDDTTLDQMAEIVAYIKANRDLIDQVTTGKVSVADIINNLTTNVTNKPLSAAQGVALKALIDGLSSGKLDASKLTEAINTALAQAKASGEFDGEKGDPGKTPVRGTDYWTPADQEAIVQDVIAALGTPVFGTVDLNKVITLNTEHLVDGTYTLGYDGEDGSFVELCTLKKGGITNLADPSSAEWKVDYRINSSGAEVTTEAGIGNVLANFIPCKAGDVVRVKGLNIAHYKYASGDVGRTNMWYYQSDKSTSVGKIIVADTPSVFVNNGDTWTFTVGNGVSGDTSKIAYIRPFGSYYDGYTANDVIITVNEEIE